MSLSRQLLSVALDLAASPDPTEAALRRSVSSLYYAVFHRLMALCADAIARPLEGTELWARVYRNLDHRQTRKRLHEVANRFPQIVAINALYRDLFANRQAADYDPTPFTFNQPAVIAMIGEVVQALQGLEELAVKSRLEVAIELMVPKRNDDSKP